MAKTLEQYKEEVQDQPAVVCVVCSAPITIGAAYAVHLQAVKGLHGMQLHQIRVSDIDAAHGGVCGEHTPWIVKRRGTVFPLSHTIAFLAEARQGFDERAARKASEAEEQAKLEAERKAREEAARKREAEIKSFFDFGDSPAAAPATNQNPAGSARRRMVEAGLVKPASNGKPRPKEAVVS